jgi:copper transport protein
VRRPVLAGLLAGAWLLATCGVAGAHAVLRDSTPAGGASLDRAPDQVLLTFTERPEPRLSTVHVLDTGGRQLEAGPAAPVDGNPLQLRVPLGELADGTYTVSWRTVSRDDGHVTAGTFAFGVGVAAPAEVPAGQAVESTTPAPSPLAVAGRWALYAGLVLLLGAAATGLTVYRGALPDGARAVLAVAAGLALAGLLVRVLAERSAVGVPLGDLLASSTGQGLLRLAAGVLVTAAAAAVLSRQPADRRRIVLVGVAAAATTLLHVLAGHAAGPSSLRPLNLLLQWVHLLAVGAWVGGLVWLLAGLRGRERPDRVRVVVGFSKLAAPVVAVVALTGLARAADLSGGLRGLLDSGYGRLLDLKVALVLGLVALGALNRYRTVPALVAERPQQLRRNVRGEVALAACVLAATAVLSQLPPGKFAGRAAARPAPPSVQVEGNDYATSVRLVLTAAPGTAGPNAFTAKVTDYDTGAAWPATRVALRFTPRDRPEVGAATLELTGAGAGLWRGQGSMLSIDGRWAVVAVVEGPGAGVTVPLELRTRAAPQQVQVSRVPGQPTLYTITLAAGGTLQTYIDPGRPGTNTVHFTFFTPAGDEQPMRRARASMTAPSGATQALQLLRLGPGHFAANVDLGPGQASFEIDAAGDSGVAAGRFEQRIE